MKKLLQNLIFFYLLFYSISLKAQLLEESNKSVTLPFNQSTVRIDIPDLGSLSKRYEESVFVLSLNFGERAAVNEGWPLKENSIIIKFDIDAYDKNDAKIENVFSDKEVQLSIYKGQTENNYIKSIKQYYDNKGDCSIAYISLKNIQTNVNNYSNEIQTIVNFKYHFKQKFAVDVSGVSVNGIYSNSKIWNKYNSIFEWSNSNGYNYPFYQLQLLRLYNKNEDPKYLNNSKIINTTINWSKAGNYIIKGNDIGNGHLQSSPFSISQGSGFYIWRIRPVSHYNIGELANVKNYGLWSENALEEGSNVIFNLEQPELIPIGCFYYEDEDSDKNYIYNKVFAERGKTKEMVQYANGLNHIKQTATYLPSENVSVITQTIVDNSGRPALVTMPVPIEGKELNYHNRFVTTTSGELYSAKHFDNENNFQNPEAINSNGNFKYYHNNTDNVASAEGYPYTRTIFYNDGTGRVKEQSGVGSTHKISSNGNTSHTTRYYYEGATEDELVSLFGKEAPNPEKVFKTVTVDPNQVVTVTFTNKEGQTLATGLSFNGEESSSLLNVGEGSEDSNYKTVINKISNNIRVKEGFISSKRIIVPKLNSDGTYPIKIDYRVKQSTLVQNCFEAEFDCNYVLKIRLYKINDDNSTTNIDENEFNLGEISVENDYKKIEAYNIMINSPGTYVVEKELFPQGLEIDIEENEGNVNNQIEGITDLINERLDEIEDLEELSEFFDELREMKNHLENKTFASFVKDNYKDYDKIYSWESNYYIGNENEFMMTLEGDPIVTGFSLSTPCCKNISVPINWTPPFDCDKDEDENGIITEDEKNELRDGIDGWSREDWPDYEKYMVEVLINCMMKYKDSNTITLNDSEINYKATVENFYKKYMYGWYYDGGVDIEVENGVMKINKLPGIFNEMVYHMAYDAYEEYPGSIKKVKYKCEDLYECWNGIILKLKNDLPGCNMYSYGMEDEKVSTAYDEEEPDEEEPDEEYKDHDPHFNNALKGKFFLVRWMAKRKISKRMRKLKAGFERTQTTNPRAHLVLEFLDCTGTNYGKILSPLDACPNEEDKLNSANFKYTQLDYSDEEMAPIPYKYTTVKESEYYGYTNSSDRYLKQDGSHYYIPVKDKDDNFWSPKPLKKDMVNNWEPIFRFIYNPYYAFKYYHYNNYGNPEYDNFETNVCFTDPNDCYLMELKGSTYYYALDSEGKRKVGPCCADQFYDSSTFTATKISDIAANCPFCYEDNNYGGNNETKLVVRDFTGVGRIKCEKTHEMWNTYQRNAFYKALDSYQLPSSLSEDGTLEGWYEEEEGTVSGNELMDEYVKLNKWYFNNENDDESKIVGLPYVTDQMITNAGHKVDHFQQIDVPEEIKDQDGRFIMIEKEMFDMCTECENNCENRKWEFRKKLYEMLNERCYVIGECRTENTNTYNVIPEDDIEELLETIVNHCKSQCDMTTFSIDLFKTRSTRYSRALFGPEPNKTEYRIQYGMGAMDQDQIDEENYTYKDNDNVFTEITDFMRKDKEGNPIKYRKYNFDIDGDQYPDELNLSWLQYTLINQVMGWDFDITLPDKCLDKQGNSQLDNVEADPVDISEVDKGNIKKNTFIDKANYQYNPNSIPNKEQLSVESQKGTSSVLYIIEIDEDGKKTEKQVDENGNSL